MIKLFVTLLKGELFHFGDAPWRPLIKKDDRTFTGPRGDHPIHPHVAVIVPWPSEDKSNGRTDSEQSSR